MKNNESIGFKLSRKNSEGPRKLLWKKVCWIRHITGVISSYFIGKMDNFGKSEQSLLDFHADDWNTTFLITHAEPNLNEEKLFKKHEIKL